MSLVRIRAGLATLLLVVVVAGGAALHLAGGAWTAVPFAVPTTAPEIKPAGDLSIVVLPFANLSNDPAQSYFADGIAQSLTNDLSRIDGLVIISPNTAFAYKGNAADARQIGKELGVRYVLEGSVQRDQNRVRVTAQLTESQTGRQVWGDTFEKPVSDLFDLQDEIVAQLSNTLRARLVVDIAARAELKPTPDSTDLFLQGLAWYYGHAPERLTKAREYFQRALDADPNNLAAITQMADVDLTRVSSYKATDRTATLASAEAALTKVLSARPDDPRAHTAMGFAQVYMNRGPEGVAEFERALALDPSLALAQAGLGYALMVNGRADETEAHIKEALRLSPRDPYAFVWVNWLALAKLYSGRDEEAAELGRRSIELNRSHSFAHLNLAAALQLLGRSDEARKEAEIALQLDANFTIRLFRANAPSDNPVYLKQRERVLEAWRAVGIPEG